jgi:hypothetical protein
LNALKELGGRNGKTQYSRADRTKEFRLTGMEHGGGYFRMDSIPRFIRRGVQRCPARRRTVVVPDVWDLRPTAI